MVQKYQSPVRVYKYPFELVMAAYEKRFPTCKMIPVFVGSEIIEEFKSEDGAVDVVERRCKLNVDCPYLLKKIVGVDHVYFIQKNSLDRRARTLKIEAHNETFSSRIVINENCNYSVHPENPDWTCFEQFASLDVKSFFGFESTVEKIAMKQYSQNIRKGKEIIEYYINELLTEGVTYIPPFQDASVPPAIKISPVECRERLKSVSSEPSQNFELGASASAISHDGLIADDKGFNLDADYIERCLGTLNPLQESCLVQLRKWVSDAHKGKIPSDYTLLRFLRARDFNVEKAREMLCQSLVWRKKHQVDRILSTYALPPVAKEYFPGGWHHYDKDGRPLYILRVGQLDVKGHIRSIGEEGVLKLTLHLCEEGLRRTEEATLKMGKPISTWTCLVDLDGLNMRHLWRPGIKALLRIIEIVESNYPETMGRVFIVRAPRVFPILWTIVSTFIDERTRQKFLFYGSSDYLGPGGLTDYIHEKSIPDFLGGPSQVAIPDGGLIPKSMYMSDEEYERERSEDNPLCEDSVYNCISLSRGQVHEVIIKNQDRGSVICWDFDIMKQDVSFMVIYTKKIISCEKPTTPTTPLSSINPLLSDVAHLSCIDKSWKEGVDYVTVEPAIICHDGESIQGSHVTSNEGTYVLQWRYHDPQHSHHAFDIIESITTHKAKVMYYYETLKSQDFRGSMSSLQSCQSGFSALSIGTTASGYSMVSSCPSR